MAATKASKKASSSKRPAKKSAPRTKPPSDEDIVRATAAAPHASLVGRENVHRIDSCPLTVTVHDGARATLEIDKHDRLSQAQLQDAVKLLNAAIQETY